MDMSQIVLSSNFDFCQPYLTLENELKETIRFRYGSEPGRHGGVKPIIKLNNYYEDFKNVFIKATLYAVNGETEHVYELDGKDCAKGVGMKKLDNDYIAKFNSLSIIKRKRDESLKLLMDKYDWEVSEEQIKEEFKEMQNTVKICFEAFINKKELLCRIFSNPINNIKNTGDLRITKLSRYSGKSSGDVPMILLCDKISKVHEVEIWFFEKDIHDNIIWEERAPFTKNDVHYQVAISFNIPKYKENVDKEVFIQLRRNDGTNCQSEPRRFQYFVDEEIESSSKRKRIYEDPVSEEASPNNIPSYEELENSIKGLLDSKDKNASEQQKIQYFLEEIHLEESLLETNDAMASEQPENEDFNDLLQFFGADLLKIDGPIFNNSNKELKNSPKKIPADEHTFTELKKTIISILNKQDCKMFLKILPNLASIKFVKSNTLIQLLIKDRECNLKVLTSVLQATPKNLINHVNDIHLTALHIAVQQRYLEVVKMLLWFGADPNLKNIDGNNCLHLAAKLNYPEILNEITLCSEINLKNKLEINALNNEGLAPLHLSLLNDSMECIEILIKAKASVNMPEGKCGKSILHLAYEKNSNLLGFLLSQAEINTLAVDFNQLIPIEYASSNESRMLKPEECCINILEESESSDDESDSSDDKSETQDAEYFTPIDEKIEPKLCEILDNNNKWKKLGLYIMDQNEIDIIEELGENPTIIILKEFKKHYSSCYEDKLKHILLEDAELKHVAKELNIF